MEFRTSRQRPQAGARSSFQRRRRIFLAGHRHARVSRAHRLITIDDSRFTIHNELTMYRRPKFLEVLLEIRRTMSRSADYDVDLFAEKIRSGSFSKNDFELNGKNGNIEKNEPEEIQDRKSKI